MRPGPGETNDKSNRDKMQFHNPQCNLPRILLQSTPQLWSCLSLWGNLKNEIPKNVSPKFSRSQSDYAVFALNNISIGRSNVIVTKFIKDNSLPNTTLYKNLGQYIGQDHHFMDANSFVPWSPAMTAPGGLVQKSNFRQALTEPWAWLWTREAGLSALYSNPTF